MKYLDHITGSPQEKKEQLDTLIEGFKEKGFRGEQRTKLKQMFVPFILEARDNLDLLGIHLDDFDEARAMFLKSMEETRWAIEQHLNLLNSN